MNNIDEMDKNLREYFFSQKFLPILTIDKKEVCRDLARVFFEAGLNTFEVTLRTKDALEVISEMSSLGNFIVGAGTLLSPSDVLSSIEAGAKFGVSPGATPELLDECERNCFPLIPGVSSPSEIMTLFGKGYKILKFFPSEILGGTKALKALEGPFPKCQFFPTGGINQNNALEYLKLPNVFGIAGSWMAPRELIREKNWSQIRKIIKSSNWKL